MVTTISGNVLTNQQVAQVAVDNGFPAANIQALTVCVAIANAESGRNISAINSKNADGTQDKGLWQINTVHDSKLPGQNRLDPNVNAKLMMMVSGNGTNWQPWTTFNNGEYQQYMAEVAKDIGNTSFVPGALSNFSPTDLIPGSESVNQVVDFVKLLMKPETWIRIGKALLGGFLVALGVLMMLKDSSRTKTVLRAGLAVATKGKSIPITQAAEGIPA